MSNQTNKTTSKKLLFFVAGLLSIIIPTISSFIIGNYLFNENTIYSELVFFTNLFSLFFVAVAFTCGLIAFTGNKNILGLIGMILSITPFILTIMTLCKPFYMLNNYTPPEKIIENKPIIDEILKYINNRYNLTLTEEDCIKSKIEEHGQNQRNSYPKKMKNSNFAVFKKDDKTIKVIENNGYMADDYQLKELNYLIGNYFSNVTDIKVDYVQIRNINNNSIKDYTLNNIYYNKITKVITNDNIENLIKKIYQEPNIEIILYVKDTDDRTKLLNDITTKLSFLTNKKFENISIYIYDKNEELSVIYLEETSDNLSDKNDINSTFGSYYVPNSYKYNYSIQPNQNYSNHKSNTFVASVHYKYNENNNSISSQTLNNWQVLTYKQ